MRTLLFILILPLKVGNCLGGQSYKNVGPCRETILATGNRRGQPLYVSEKCDSDSITVRSAEWSRLPPP